MLAYATMCNRQPLPMLVCYAKKEEGKNPGRICAQWYAGVSSSASSM
jgi:hypothetical protein